MEGQNEEHAATRLLEAQTHIWNHALSFINSVSLKSAEELDIPDIIHKYGKPMPFSQLMSSLPIHPSKAPNMYRLMSILTHSGFFSLHPLSEPHPSIPEHQGYVLTDASTLLLKDNPFSVTPHLHIMLDPVLTNPWYHLSSWLQNDDPTPFNTAHGKTFWDYASCDSRFNHRFNDAMANDAGLVAKVVIDKCTEVFKGLESLVDVGGGTGTMAKAIAKAFPEMECTVLDLPHVVGGLQDSDNLKFVGGDMREAIPPANCVLLKWILHNWKDEECEKILRKCKEAITSKGKEGKVLIIDMVMANEKGDMDNESVETQLLFDMMMMVLFNGKERTEKEWANLIFSAGFTAYKITHLLGVRSLIQLYP